MPGSIAGVVGPHLGIGLEQIVSEKIDDVDVFYGCIEDSTSLHV